MKFKLLITSLIIFIGFLYITGTIAEDDGGFKGGEGIEDIGKGFGSLAIAMLGIGAIYVVLRRGYLLAKKYELTKNPEFGEQIVTLYKTLRGPTMFVHMITNIAATLFAIIHGIMATEYTQITFYSGWIAVIMMVILSISGSVIYFKFKPFWKYRESRTFIRFLHRQWIFSVILAIAVLIHLALAEDD